MNLIERVKGIVLRPKSEWPAIASESGEPGHLFPNYVCILAAIPVVSSFIGASIIGMGPFRVGIVSGLLHAVVIYALTLASVFIVAYVIDGLAGVFGGQKNIGNAMRISAYAPTAAWLAGIFNMIPALSLLSLLGLYSFYLLHTGIVALMQPRQAVGYTVTVVICVMVIQAIIFFVIVRTIFGMPHMY